MLVFPCSAATREEERQDYVRLLHKGYARHVADEAKFLLRSHSDEAWGEKAEEDRGQRTEFCEEMRRGWKRRAEKRRLARKFSSRGVRGGLLGGSRAAFGRVRGRLGGAGRTPGGVPGPLGTVLGWSWGDLRSHLVARRCSITFWTDFGREKGGPREAFWEPKWCQNRFQNGVGI